MTVAREPDALTRKRQEQASDPAGSAWVSAHAGSGKTHVLASRVIRLLLDGVPPSRILCLTFTKAAAANMSARVFRTLADWTLADDASLMTKLAMIGARDADLGRARRMFATAVETPGGLKIQTIHAFCERLLHLFPFEANVPAEFRLLDETESVPLMARARRAALAAMLRADHPLMPMLRRVAAETTERNFDALVDRMLQYRALLLTSDAQTRNDALRATLDLSPGENETGIRQAILEVGIPATDWAAIAARMASGSANDRKCAERLRYALSLVPTEASLPAYFDVFLTGGKRRKSILTKPLCEADRSLAARIDAEADRIENLSKKWFAANVAARTQALEAVCTEVIREYTKAKRAAGVLDFDDLIDRTDALLHESAASDWVLFKLDGGIDHILVDEAQDTSEPQWRILMALAREFTAGAGRPRRLRTFFAVGDEKQSIFSFQGAAPAKFDEMRRAFHARAAAARQVFNPVRLQMSFRSSPTILEAVDTVFRHDVRGRGLSADGVIAEHTALRARLPGLVELWPLIAGEPEGDRAEWALPPDAVRKGDPAVRLARKVSAKIRMLLDSGRESVEDSDTGHRRPVRPGDIMILVRTRGPFFQAIVRALKNESVAVAGADRLDVVGHIAVMDCLAAAQAALVPDDDLAVATVFTSPLGGLDDTDLIALAPRRTGTLTQALETSADERHRALAARLAGWRDLAAGATPFEFFSLVLGAQLGRQHLVGRLGSEADDALDEFLALALAHERQGPPSLKRFLAEMAGLSFDVKRDLESAGDAVRVMTVHGAKGLEAKIVFLPDTCGSLSREGNDPKLFALPAGGSQVLAWPGVKAEDTDVMVAARQRLKEEEENESRRLLYVAMTRAEERLYIAGSYKVRKSSVTWHAMIDEALRPVSDEIDDPLEKGGRILRMGGIEDAGLLEPVSSRALPGVAPEWLFEPATPEQDATPPLRPSSVLAGADAREPLASARTQALRRGVAIHTLLRRLPDLVPDARAESARAYLAGSFPDLSSAHDAMTASVLAVIDDPVLEPLFGAASLAEIPLVARIERSGGRAPIEIAGQIDRLAETPDAIWLADYKTGVAPAGLPPEAHIAQMALYAAALRQIYPGRPVRAVLIYTQEPRVVTLAPEAIKAALSNVLAQGQAA